MNLVWRHIQAYVHSGRIGVLVEFCVESSFTLRTPEFAQLSKDIAMHIAATAPQDLADLRQQVFVKDDTITIAQLLANAKAEFREEITVTRFVRWDTSDSGEEPTTAPDAPANVMRFRKAQ